MELRQLAALEAVLEQGSFAAAARARHVAQPALWAQVKGLERELATRLFERVGRGVRPTRGALVLRQRVRRVLEDVRQLELAATEVREGRAVPATIGCAPYSVPHLLSECCVRLKRARPELPLPVIVSISSGSGPAALESGELDLAILPLLDEPPAHGAPMYPVWISVYGRGVGRGPFELGRLDGAPVATLPPDTAVGMLLRTACRKAGIQPKLVLETRDVASLRAFADRGLATAVVVNEALEPAQLARSARLALEGRLFQTELWLHWRSEDSLTPGARALRSEVLALSRRKAGPGRVRSIHWPLGGSQPRRMA